MGYRPPDRGRLYKALVARGSAVKPADRLSSSRKRKESKRSEARGGGVFRGISKNKAGGGSLHMRAINSRDTDRGRIKKGTVIHWQSLLHSMEEGKKEGRELHSEGRQ